VRARPPQLNPAGGRTRGRRRVPTIVNTRSIAVAYPIRRALIVACILLLGACTRQVSPVPDNPAVTDPLIHRAVTERLETLPVVTLAGVEIRVRQGIVDVDGYVMSQSEITRISRAIRGIDGVRAVRNTLRVPSSGSGIRSGIH
jgi:hypothetical protein